VAALELTFVDTNILFYAQDQSETDKQPRAQALLEALWSTRTGCLSTQVLQEFYVVATRKLSPPLGRREAREIVALYATWPLIQVDLPLILGASELEERYNLSFWDALVIEAARRAGATRLMSEDLQAGQTISGVRIENPLA
jgi:predicted nucleic acid-binding protein